MCSLPSFGSKSEVPSVRNFEAVYLKVSGRGFCFDPKNKNKGSKYCFVGQSFILKKDPVNGGRVIAVDSDQSPS